MCNTVEEAITRAEKVIPWERPRDQGKDPRWQAVIAVGEFVVTDPEPAWAFVLKWGSSDDDDLRAAVGTCLLEHLLEHHFEMIFPRVEQAARNYPLFADTFLRCWKMGQSEIEENSARIDTLKAICRRHA